MNRIIKAIFDPFVLKELIEENRRIDLVRAEERGRLKGWREALADLERAMPCPKP